MHRTQSGTPTTLSYDEILEGLDAIVEKAEKRYGPDHRQVLLIRAASEAIRCLRDERQMVFAELHDFLNLLERFT